MTTCTMLTRDGKVCGKPAVTLIECRKKVALGVRGSAVFVCGDERCAESGAKLFAGLERQGYTLELIPIHYVLVIDERATPAPNPSIQNAN